MTETKVNPSRFLWARERANLPIDSLTKQFPKYKDWELGNSSPTFKQLQKFAKKTHAPIGYFFCTELPKELLPIPDFRTIGGECVEKPSINLIDTIYLCQRRQSWYREYALSEGLAPLKFVGSASLNSDIAAVASDIRNIVQFSLHDQKSWKSRTDILKYLIDKADEIGVLVMVSGVVGNDTHRKLDANEFRGFAMSDKLAPLIFINRTDVMAAQIFTFAHELAHIWLNDSGLSNASLISTHSHKSEKWCNHVAAELLVPLADLKENYDTQGNLQKAIEHLVKLYKVSSLVIIRRIYDAGGLTYNEFNQVYKTELEKQPHMPAKKGGGNFYHVQTRRLGKRFSKAIVAKTLAGQNSFKETFRLLGIRDVVESLREFA